MAASGEDSYHILNSDNSVDGEETGSKLNW